uniref:Uncharacterized protein n=1 Tax=Megaselia scalaris TaxID=36166 RepID=T1GWV0_MEGSC
MSRQQQVKIQNVAKSKSSNGLPTFLRWFKKSKETVNPSGALSSASQISSSQDSLGDLENRNNFTTSSESLVSTATNGFAFIQPKNYEQTNGIGIKTTNIENHPVEESSSLLRRIRLHNTRRNHQINCRISLKEKYCLQESDTLPSNKHRIPEGIECTYENLDPNRRHTADNKNFCRNKRNNFRRTVSDSSKDISSGAYSHVKGKRRAPAPPKIEMPVQVEDQLERKSSVSVESTLSRKKRRAPPPPNLTPTSNDISDESSKQAPTSPPEVAKCSPRPWYKRSVAINKNSDIPFKREINLKTMEKRKKKDFNKKMEKEPLPDCANSRVSIFDANNKLSILLRNKQEEKDRRKSGIAMPNISELDKETDNFIKTRESLTLTNDIILQQKMFEQASSSTEQKPVQESTEPKSSKDLIAKFESQPSTSKSDDLDSSV